MRVRARVKIRAQVRVAECARGPQSVPFSCLISGQDKIRLRGHSIFEGPFRTFAAPSTSGKRM